MSVNEVGKTPKDQKNENIELYINEDNALIVKEWPIGGY
jgi:hypothetical protein